MIYKKMIKNVLLSQYYENCVRINEYFNRQIPIVISMLLTVMCQISGGLVLTFFAIVCSKAVDGNLIFLYFTGIAWIQSFLQGRRDYDTYNALYEQSIFVYGYNNKKSLLSNSIAYGVLNTIANPMVFLPYYIFTGYWFGNPIVLITNLLIPILLYITIFVSKDNKVGAIIERRWLLEIVYIFKSIIVIVTMRWMLFFIFKANFETIKGFNMENLMFANSAGYLMGRILLYLPMILAAILVINIGILIPKICDFRCKIFGDQKKEYIEKWVFWLANHCRDVKVKSDLLIIARRRDLWKDNASLAFFIPNTVLLITELTLYIKNDTALNVDPITFLLVTMLFEIIVMANFGFKSLSFMMFHNSELENIYLYRMRGKDARWIFRKKVKLLCILLSPSLLFINIIIFVLGCYWKWSFIYLVLPIVSLVFVGIVSFILMCWMHFYKHRYTNYEEFSTKKISLSLMSQFSTIPLLLFCLPFIFYLFNLFAGDMIIDNTVILKTFVWFIAGGTLFAGCVYCISIRKWKIKY